MKQRRPFPFRMLPLFLGEAVRNFQSNQGLLLAGAVAYYTLLSVIPLLSLLVFMLTRLFDPAELLQTLGQYLDWLVPSQSDALLRNVEAFLGRGASLGLSMGATLLFFSSLAFSALEKSMHIIFSHRRAGSRRHFLASVVLPYSAIFVLGLMLLATTVVSIALQTLSSETIGWGVYQMSLQPVSTALNYGLGIAMEMLALILIYLVAPIGKTRLLHAFVAALMITALWEAMRHGLVWYFGHLSKVSVVYGSLSTAVVVLFAFEIAATLVLMGAQLIADHERRTADRK